MSAIAGIIQLDGRPVDRATLERMQKVLTPYGKDNQNCWYQGTVGMLRTLLRTTPEDQLDQQPLFHAESGTTLIFDGRIDNREELANSLGLSPTEIALMADSDLVLRTCLRWETQAAERLLGDFALACWQAPRRRLWLARDSLAMRPLFWHQQPDFFAFATMPKALFAVPGIPKTLNEKRLHDYLCMFDLVGPESFFKNIYRVEAGQTLVLENNRVTTRQYHRFDPDRKLRLSSDDEYLQAFREHLERAVACRLRSIGPIASHLSSGFDSSTVTAVAARQLAEKNERIVAYTAVPREGFTGPVPKGRHGDEGPGARALAARFDNIEHILIRPNHTSLVDSLRQDIEILDQPPQSPCDMLWDHAIRTDAVQRGSRTLLSGTMGNVTISYDGMFYLSALLGRGQWLRLWRELRAMQIRQPECRWRQLMRQPLQPHLLAVRRFILRKDPVPTSRLMDYSAIHPGFMARMNTDRARGTSRAIRYRPWADGRRMRAEYVNCNDVGEYFAADNVSGLERRDPTADRRLIEFCLAIPEGQYWREGQPRWLLRRFMGSMLPAEILQARTQGYQAADWFESAGRALPQLREDLAQLMAHGSAGNYLDLDWLKKALDGWPESGWESGKVRLAYRRKLLWGLSVGIFVAMIGYEVDRNFEN